jgi:DNA polymerase III epsilon subunit-like protein
MVSEQQEEKIEKPKGYFQYLLAIDCETTGLNWDDDDPSNGHQALSWGIIVADAKTLKSIEELYIEIKYNDDSRLMKQTDPEFGIYAADIHGLTFDYLEKNGISEEEAVLKIANLILKYWGPTSQVKTLGHNVHVFDVPFLRSMFRRHGIEIPLGSRHYDTNSIGFATTGAYISDALFETMGFDPRGSHNALEDAKMALESARRVRVLWNDKVKIHAYD